MITPRAGRTLSASPLAVLLAAAAAAALLSPAAAAQSTKSGKGGAPSPAVAATPVAPAPTGPEYGFEELGLKLRFPAEMAPTPDKDTKDPQVQRAWNAKLGAAAVHVQLALLPREEFELDEPSQVIEVVGEGLTSEPRDGVAFRFGQIEPR